MVIFEWTMALLIININAPSGEGNRVEGFGMPLMRGLSSQWCGGPARRGSISVAELLTYLDVANCRHGAEAGP
jgi:hypothetical protein